MDPDTVAAGTIEGGGTDDVEIEVADSIEGAEDLTPEAPAAKPNAEVAELRKQLGTQQKRLTELEASEQYWERVANSRKPDTPGTPVTADDDEEAGEFADLLAAGEGEDPKDDPELDPEKFIDELTSKGPKALDKVIAKASRGYVKKEDVVKLAAEVAKRAIAKERGKITIDARLASEFGDLKDETSPLFRETQKVFREMVQLDPKLASRPSAVLLAARAAKGNLAGKNGNRREEPDRPRRESEEQRRERIDSQQGETGRGRRVAEEDEDLGPEARRIVDVMKPFGINEERYRKAARRA